MGWTFRVTSGPSTQQTPVTRAPLETGSLIWWEQTHSLLEENNLSVISVSMENYRGTK